MANKKKIISALINFSLAKVVTFFVPVKKNKFFCMAMGGNSYGDNIKCLSDYIFQHYSNPQIVWTFTDAFINKSNCEHNKVLIYSFLYYYHILTAHYILHNIDFKFWQYQKRKGQIILNTWHGTPLKHIGKDYRDDSKSIMGIKYDYVQTNALWTDIFVSGSRFMSEVCRRAFLQKTNLYEVGTPRNDVFFHKHPEIEEKLRNLYGLKKDYEIMLYAPTFRTDFSVEYYDIDLQRLKKLWEDKTGKKVKILIRWHPKFVELQDNVNGLVPKGAIDVTSYPDMQELLYVTDVLVTDYSSSMFDFMYTKRPIILYVPDKELYDRGFYFDIEKLPFIIVNKNSELDAKINQYEGKKYISGIEKFFQEIGSVEKGDATQKAYELLMEMT